MRRTPLHARLRGPPQHAAAVASVAAPRARPRSGAGPARAAPCRLAPSAHRGARARQELACALSALGFPYRLDLLLATARAAVARADPFTGAAAAPYDVRDLEAAARRVAHLEGLGLLDVAAGPGRASESA